MPHHSKRLAVLIGAAIFQLATPAAASDWIVKPQWVQAHEDFLASTVMQGRGSATRDEAIAAQYVAAQFESFGIQPAPGMTAYLQSGRIVLPGRPGEPETSAETTNAIGYLPGTDPNAGILLVSAHLDHLGLAHGTVMPGANDDASGTTAVLELARALASGDRMRRGILFVCYGSEELGGLGSRYFGAHPPLPLSSIVANLELEMIGAQDPKMPAGYMMMTGFDRSDFGEMLKKNGALVAPDPYPEQHFFQRSDNYSLALQGIVAHTVSGWPLTPTYHQPTDTVANLDVAFMTRAIQSLIDPLRLIANGSETPRWRPGGRPVEKK
jgi:Zn-dependent M28 family amino/carboxypeptidase